MEHVIRSRLEGGDATASVPRQVIPYLTVDPNVIIGVDAGWSLPASAYNNVFIGRLAGSALSYDMAAWSSLGRGMVAIGDLALAGFNATFPSNTAIGTYALKLLTGGEYNTAVGWRALQALSGNWTGNTAFGGEALANMSQGNSNTGLGWWAGKAVPTGVDAERNTFVGMLAGGSGDRLRSYNTAVGARSLFTATGTADIDYSTALGYQALGGSGSALLTAGLNTALGAEALMTNTSGTHNTAAGYRAGYFGVVAFTGSRDLFLGALASPSIAGVNDAIAIGYNAQVGRAASGIAIGSGASAGGLATTGVGGIAIGHGASVSGSGAIAIGRDSAGTAAVSGTTDRAVIGTTLTSLQVGDPGGGSGAWKLGKYLTGTVALDTAHYLEVLIDGTVRKLLVAA